MEFVDTNLERIIRSRQDLTEEHIAYFMAQLLDGVRYMHAHRIIHRDLQPENLLVTGDCKLVISNFRLSREIADKDGFGCPLEIELQPINGTEHVVSRQYRAPELWLDERYAYAVDMWSCGCILGELLGRRSLFMPDCDLDLLEIFKAVGWPSPSQIEFIDNPETRRSVLRAAENIRKELLYPVPLETLFTTAPPAALALLKGLLAIDPRERWTADVAFRADFLKDLVGEFRSDLYPPMGKSIDFSFEDADLSKEQLVELIKQEAESFHQERYGGDKNALRGRHDRLDSSNFEDIDGVLDSLAILLLDTHISDFAEAEFAGILVDLALELGQKAWGRSKIMFVGPGRAGKTGTERAIMGQPFEDTASTTGINDEWVCEVTYDLAHVDNEAASESVANWKQAEKRDKEYEAAVATLATGLKRGQVEKEIAPRHNEMQQAPETVTVHEHAEEEHNEMELNEDVAAKLEAPLAVDTTIPDTGSSLTTTVDGFEHVSSVAPLLPVKGIDEVKYEDAVRLLGEQQMNSKLLISMLDFGGQKIFDAIHQFFMTPYAAYVVVFNMECYLSREHGGDPSFVNPDRGVTSWKECLKNVKQWVGSIGVHTTQEDSTLPAPIFIVGSHKDLVPSAFDHKAMSTELTDILGTSNPATRNLQWNEDGGLCFFPVNNTIGRDDPMIKLLMKQMEAVIEEEDYVKQKRPLLWFRVLDWINSQDRSYLTYDEVAKFARQNGFDTTTTKALDDMLRMFHESSALMWHSEEGLRHLVIREPISFFVKPVTNVICQHIGTASDKTVHELPGPIRSKVRRNETLSEDFMQLKRTGIVSRSLLQVLLGDDEHWEVIQMLMEKYALLVPLRRDDSEASDANPRYLVPALLPEAENDGDVSPTGIRFFFYFSASTIKGSFCQSEMRDKGFLPGGLFTRVLGVVLAWSQETMMSQANYWSCHRHGMTVYFGAQRFQLTHRADINAIEVQLFGAGTPLAVHARLKTIVSQLVKQFFKSLHWVTLLDYTAGVARPAIQPSTLTEAGPLLIPLDDIRNLIAGRVDILALATGVELRPSLAADLYGQFWAPDSISEVDYDVFLSYRWGKWDTAFTAMLEDHLRNFTFGDDIPRPFVTFLDVIKLELGLDFKEAFVKALTRSKFLVPIVSHDALDRMINHDSTAEDNVLIEWLCAKYCLKHGIIKRIIPILFGKRTAFDTFGGFFDKDESNGDLTVLQRLATCDATATVTKASQLLRDAGVLGGGVVVEPSLFGVSSFAVRDIVKAITDCNGIFAKDCSSLLQLLQKCGGELKRELKKCISGDKDSEETSKCPKWAPQPAGASEVDGRRTPVALLEGFDAAWAVLQDKRFVADEARLQAFLADGYERDMMDTWDEEVIASIKEFLNGGGKKAFESKWRKAVEK